VKFHPQRIPQVFLIEPEPFIDQRGLLRRHYCQKEFAPHNILQEIKQCNISENRRRHTLRGFHFQKPPYEEGRVLSCVKGAIYDIIVDLRSNSSTYLTWISAELSDENRLSLYTPPGCANGYLTLQDNTWILYYHSQFYTPQAEAGIRYNDPFFNFAWPVEPAVISQKDLHYPDFVPSQMENSQQ